MTRFLVAWRWVFVPPSTLLDFIVAFALTFPLNRAIHHYLWGMGRAVPGKDFLMLVLPFDGALAAFLVVVCGAFAAPTHRVRVALVVLFSGSIIAWILVGQPYSPQWNHHGTIQLWWPICGTYLGGLLAFSTVRLAASCHRVNKANQPESQEHLTDQSTPNFLR